jgi:hypothetical protein
MGGWPWPSAWCDCLRGGYEWVRGAGVSGIGSSVLVEDLLEGMLGGTSLTCPSNTECLRACGWFWGMGNVVRGVTAMA